MLETYLLMSSFFSLQSCLRAYFVNLQPFNIRQIHRFVMFGSVQIATEFGALALRVGIVAPRPAGDLLEGFEYLSHGCQLEMQEKRFGNAYIIVELLLRSQLLL